ncbi:MAG: hypothetical protein FWG01_04165 [Betaproteobacteria bacterium]|nr:hypothetical protein [Betaproteobacteria bacterium]
MTSVPCLLDFRVVAGYFLVCMTFLLSGCGGSAQQPGSQDAQPPDGTLRFSATLSYEDRQMMRRHLVRGLHDGIIATAEMQARIDCSHSYGCPQSDGKSGAHRAGCGYAEQLSGRTEVHADYVLSCLEIKSIFSEKQKTAYSGLFI